MTVVITPPVGAAAVAARMAYASLFTIGLPVLLAWWAIALDEWLVLPAYRLPWAGFLLTVGGLVLMLIAMRDLWARGGGLPASPFPPRRLVTTGAYRFVSHPIYIGAVAAAFGCSLMAGSAAGLWIVSPTLAMAAAAFVVGFERDATANRFGGTAVARLRIAEDTSDRPAPSDRLSVYVLVFLPWLVLYQAVEALGVPPDAVVAHFRWESDLPVLPWTEAIYASTYPFVLAGPLVAKRCRDLRAFALDGLWATAIAIPVYLIVPLIVPARPIPGDGFWQSIMQWERAFDAPVTAFPAFHVVWTVLAAQLWAATYPRLTGIWFGLAAAVAVSCITTGLHAVVDVIGGLALAVALRHRQRLWRRACDGAEWIANAWREITIGPVRLMGHGSFAAGGAVLGVFISLQLAGLESAGWIFGLTVTAIVGAGLWGQFVEGSPRLLRPYGYFGSVAAVAVACLVAAIAGADGWLLFTAFGVGGAFTQAIGRLRCLTNGCCHGREADPSLGIRYSHPHSRVVRLTTLAGRPLYPTPLYSAVWMLAVGVILLRLWALAVPLQFIAGSYFILTGLGRFVEEHYRGEPQTVVVGGLRLYQWLAIAFLVGGAVLTTLGTDPAPARQSIGPGIFPLLVAVGLIAYVAYGVDLPRSDRRFSRLT